MIKIHSSSGLKAKSRPGKKVNDSKLSAVSNIAMNLVEFMTRGKLNRI